MPPRKKNDEKLPQLTPNEGKFFYAMAKHAKGTPSVDWDAAASDLELKDSVVARVSPRSSFQPCISSLSMIVHAQYCALCICFELILTLSPSHLDLTYHHFVWLYGSKSTYLLALC